jgi:hypothetical protein
MSELHNLPTALQLLDENRALRARLEAAEKARDEWCRQCNMTSEREAELAEVRSHLAAVESLERTNEAGYERDLAAARAEATRLRAALKRTHELLVEVQFGYMVDNACPWCDKRESDGHADYCALVPVLTESKTLLE